LAREQRTLEVYEDGRIVRDFVYIDDVVEALFAAVEGPAAQPRCLDIGSGTPTTIHELAQTIAAVCHAPEPIVVAKFRDGDVRAAKCDIEPARKELGWRPQWVLEEGLRALLDWIGEQPELPLGPSDHTPARRRDREVEQVGRR
jgi:dTDP-L-rhamnose 4-epimerase